LGDRKFQRVGKIMKPVPKELGNGPGAQGNRELEATVLHGRIKEDHPQRFGGGGMEYSKMQKRVFME